MNDIPANSINQPQANPAPVNTNPVVPNKPKSSSNKKTCIILAVVGVVVAGGLILMAILAVFFMSALSTSDQGQQKAVSTSTAENVNTDTSDLMFADGKDLPPVSKSYSDPLLTKTYLLSPESGYYTLINAVGRPSYTFAFLYNKDWKTQDRSINNLILKDDAGLINYGIVSFNKDSKVYNYTCEGLLKDVYAQTDTKITMLGNQSVTLNGEVWDRVEYKSSSGGMRGVHQCLRRPGLLIDQFFITSTENWYANSPTYMKLLDDVYVSPNASAW